MMVAKHSLDHKKERVPNHRTATPNLGGRILNLLIGAVSSLFQALIEGPHVLILSLALGGLWAVMSGVSLWAISHLSGRPNSLSPFEAILLAPLGVAVGAMCSPFAMFFLRRKPFGSIAKLLFVMVTPCVLMIPVLVYFLSMKSMLPLDGVLVILVGSAACYIGASAIAKTLLPDVEENVRSCETCCYNLIGNTSGICPECGTPVPEDIQKELTPSPPKQ